MKYLKKFNEQTYKWENNYVDLYKVIDELIKILHPLGIFICLEHNPPAMDNYYHISFCLGHIQYSIMKLIVNGYKLQDNKKWLLGADEEVYPLIGDGREQIGTVIYRKIHILPYNTPIKHSQYNNIIEKDEYIIYPENNDELYKTVVEYIITIFKRMTDITTVNGAVLRTSKDFPLKKFRNAIIECLNKALNKEILIPQSAINYINKIIGIYPDKYQLLNTLLREQPLIYDAIKTKSTETGKDMGEMGF